MLKLSKKLVFNSDVIKAPNLVDRFSPEDLSVIGDLTWSGYDKDVRSRDKWFKRMRAGMDLALQVQKDKSFPWQGSSNVVFPLITIAALQFSARSYTNIIQGMDVVKYRTVGDDPEGKLKAQADRIGRHMSWQVLEEDFGWEEQHDRLLINLAIVGCNFIKTFWDPHYKHNVSLLVPAKDFILDYYARSVEDCGRKTERLTSYRNEIYEKSLSGIYRDVRDSEWFNNLPTSGSEETQSTDNIQGIVEPLPDEDTPFRLLEQHRLLDLDQDGYAEPYIVTIEENSHEVIRIVSRVDREDAVERSVSKEIRSIKATEYYTKYSFIPSPDGGVYDFGFGSLLGPLNESVNTAINQLLDAGTMRNSLGGFLGRGAKIKSGGMAMAPWEWKRVDATGDDLRKSMIPLPINEPSAVLYNLLGLLINYTDRIAGTVDQMVGENPGQNTPAETSRNMTEQGMQVYSMVFKRVWRSMKEEFKKLHHLNSLYLRPKETFGKNQFVMQEDYRTNPNNVVPVADPSITSNAARMAQASAVKQTAMVTPGYDLEEVERYFLKALKVDGVDTLYKGPKNVPPLPNPKVQVEQMKLQIAQAKIASEKQTFVLGLYEARKKTMAEIRKLTAETELILAEVDQSQIEVKLSALDRVINMMKAHTDMLGARIKASEGEEGGENDKGGMGQLEAASGNSGVPGGAGPEGGVPQVPMGGPDVSGGQPPTDGNL